MSQAERKTQFFNQNERKKNAALRFECVPGQGLQVRALLRNGKSLGTGDLTSHQQEDRSSTVLSRTVYSLCCLSRDGTSPPRLVPNRHLRLTSRGCGLLLAPPAQLLALGRCSVNVCSMTKEVAGDRNCILFITLLTAPVISGILAHTQQVLSKCYLCE